MRMVASLQHPRHAVPLAVVAAVVQEQRIVGFFWKRVCASCGDTVPVSALWQVRHVRPLPPNVSCSKRRLPSFDGADPGRRPKSRDPRETRFPQHYIARFSWCSPSDSVSRPQLRRPRSGHPLRQVRSPLFV